MGLQQGTLEGGANVGDWANLFDKIKLTAFSEIFKMASRLWKQQCA